MEVRFKVRRGVMKGKLLVLDLPAIRLDHRKGII
jgi:hypothetical protein